jgi:cytochrome c
MRAHWFPVIALFGWIATAGAIDNDCSNASSAEAKALALKAATQLESLGKEQAFRNFMDPDGEFFPRDLYVIVVDIDGIMWVNGAYPQGIGSNALDAQDQKGRRFIEQMLRLAADQGEGWVEYQWFNPCTGEYGEKRTFFKRVGRFVVAVGAYRNPKNMASVPRAASIAAFAS